MLFPRSSTSDNPTAGHRVGRLMLVCLRIVLTLAFAQAVVAVLLPAIVTLASPLLQSIFNGLCLAVIAAPILYYWIVKPLDRDLVERTARAESQREQLAAIARDLECSRQLADAANQAKSEFLASMSHEIRTPMTAILGFAELLQEQGVTAEQSADALRTIRRNGEHLLTVINDVLDLSKIEAGAMTVERIACSPVSIVDDVVALLRGRAADKKLALKVEYHCDLPATIKTDPTRFRQILVNLVGNAIKFTPSGSITLGVGLENSQGAVQLRVDVTDTGIGMSDEEQAMLFRPFQQAGLSTARKFGGSGLGLTISRKLARSLGGEISLVSAPERGSTFTVRVDCGSLAGVPMVNPAAGRAIAMPTAAPRASLAGLRVLLAEDGIDNQRLIRFILERSGAAAVDVVANGLQALQRVQQQPYDVILLDMVMPEMDGYEAAGELRRRHVATPIIALTAHAMAGDRDKCITAGCTDYLTKPIDRAALVTTIARCVPSLRNAA